MKHGQCHLCGEVGPLSFEHIPPRSAFNDRPIVNLEIEKVLVGDPESKRGRIQQRGSGEYTLCQPCNNKTGSWYGNEYASWAAQGMEALSLLRPGLAGDRRFFVCPLNVFKEIVCLMCSVNASDFTQRNPEVRSFVLNRNSREWNPDFQIYMNFNVSNRMRFAGSQGVHRFGHGTSIVSEITFPPFGYLMTHRSVPPSAELVSINFFTESTYNELREIWISMPVVNPYTGYPADYRDKDQVLKQAGNG